MSVHPQSGIALCLSSSFCGYHAHAGFLTELIKQGIQPDRISGASAGALVAGLWGAGVRDERLQHLLGSAAFKWAFWEWLAIPRFHLCLTGFGPSGMLTGKRFRKFLHRHISDAMLEDLTDPQIEIAVTNISLLSSQIKSSGKLLDLIVASLAVPMLFAVQKIDGHEYLDGGIANALPYEHWLDQPEIHTIIIHKIAHQATFQKVPWRTPLNVTASAHTCTAHELERLRSEKASRMGKKIIYVTTETPHPGIFQGRKAPILYDLGRESAKRFVTGEVTDCG
jgi:predicted acylesterase/phospholipase RssA